MLVRAAVTLPVTTISIKALGYARTRAAVTRLTRARRARPDGAELEERIVRSKDLVDWATTRVPGSGTCLPRSLTLWSLLRSQGIDSEVVIAVRTGGEPLDAHAWVERAGRPLNESPEVVATYTPLRPGSTA